MDNPNQNSSGGYGKRPMWQWVAIYVVIGAVVYGLVYYVWLRKSGGSYDANAPATTDEATAPYSY